MGHSEINPKEMVWSKVKHIVAMENLTFQLTADEEETKRQIEKV